MSKKIQTSFSSLILFIVLIFKEIQCDSDRFSNFLDSNEEKKGMAWKCLFAGKVYHPDNRTTCVCTSLLVAECRPNDVISTTNRPRTTTKPPVAALHPLDPLTPDEICLAKQIIEHSKPNRNVIYNWITLQEPPKADLLPYFLTDVDPPRSAYQRKAFVILIQNDTGKVCEVVVNLDTRMVERESYTAVPEGYIPTRTPDDDNYASDIVKANETVRERCRRLGFPDMDLVYPVPWPLGYADDDKPQYKGLKRPYNVFMYGRTFKTDHPYAHPFDFMVVVDLIEGRVIDIEELPTHDDFDASNKEGNVVPREPDNVDYRLKPANFLRKNDKPITVTSPEGPAYKIHGNQIEWQNFKMRVGFNAREGLVIYNVAYNDNGNVRPILYRASFGEIGISYADPRPPFHRKFGFDEGEYGLGLRANSLKDQEHCIGETRYFDGVLNNNTGDPRIIKNAICITEEDAGILWSHLDTQTNQMVVVRSHRLAISFVITAGNYDFVFRWLFYQDASIQLQTQLTGVLSTNMLALRATPAGYGTTVFPQVNGQYHQHYFSLRLDVEIDGNENSVYTSEAVPLEGGTGSATNPNGNGFENKRKLLKTAAEARTNTSPSTGRVWVVTNPSKNNAYTEMSTGWKLIPAVTPPLLIRKDSPLHPKVAFLDYNFWATRYHENQFYSGGFYLNNSGLPEWVGKDPDASVVNTDIVLWHNFGPTHIPRVEDFPVMPVEDLQVWMKPYNFFLGNPGLDVPPASVRKTKQEL